MPTKYFASTDTYVELKDTMKLQKASLDEFAANLHYFWDKDQDNYVKWNDRDAMGRVSLNTMQNWHNGDFHSYGLYSWHGEDIIVEAAKLIGLSTEYLKRAINSKLVQTTHLQYSKKQHKLLCTDHQIQFV